MRCIFSGLALIVAAGAWPGELLAGQKFDEISHTVQQFVRDQQLPSVVVAVAKNGRIVWEEGSGWADRDRQIPTTPHTPYSLASITKPFTATAVMKLVESGDIALDRQANDYLGDARITGRDAGKATVRRILSHTGGLPHFFRPSFDGRPVPIEEIIARHAVLSSRPGRRHVYSNLGYGVLEHIVQRVSGVSYDDYMRREVFLPLRLESAFVPVVSPPDNAAVRYDAHSRPLQFYDVGHRGASAVYASAHDLVRFGMFHLDRRLEKGEAILTRKSLDEMQRIQTPESSTVGYGLGWRIEEHSPGFRRVGHTGGMPGVTTVLSLYPAQRVVIVVLANKQNEAVVALERKIAAAMIPLHRWGLRHHSR